MKNSSNVLLSNKGNEVYFCVLVKTCDIHVLELRCNTNSGVRLTLDDGQEDDDDEEEKRDVKHNAFNLKLISSRVLNLITYASACTDSNIHVEHVALKEKTFSFIVQYPFFT